MSDLKRVDLSLEEPDEDSLGPERQVSKIATVDCQFVTGNAGTGKTYSVRQKIKEDRKWGKLCATTGIAAVNLAEGTNDTITTINSLLKYFDTDSMAEGVSSGSIERQLAKVAMECRHIVIDEVSMMPAMQLDLLYQAVHEVNQLQEVQERGGLGIILTGDFCLAVGTKVMMADGSLCPVELVIPGQFVMGPDFKPRLVKRTIQGIAQLFQIDQTNGDSYTVTSNHLLALRRSNDGNRKEAWGQRYPTWPTSFYLRAPDLANKSGKFRECFVGYKAGIVQLPSKPVDIDPYFLGLWLGDGDSTAARITTSDIEVSSFCRAYAQKLGLKITEKRCGKCGCSKTTTLHLSAGRHGPTTFNPLWEGIVRHGLNGNKHIPELYLLNGEDIRLALLAGLLDSDGCWHGNRYTITLAKERLIREVKQLADGLGFRAAIREVTNGPYKEEGKEYPWTRAWTVSIGGDTWHIPCRIARKQSKPRQLGRSRLTSTLSITPVGPGKYAGFELDGDRLFLLADGTVTHNCQLPPVKAPYCFHSQCWPGFEQQTSRLTKCWRQTDLDFLEAINAARVGDGDKAAELMEALAQQKKVSFQRELDTNFDGTTIFSKNVEVDRLNGVRHLKLLHAGKFPWKIPSSRWGKQRGEWSLIPEVLEVCQDAYVMILCNDSPEFTYANGSCGLLRDIQEASFVESQPGQNVPQSAVVELKNGRGQVVVPKITRRCVQKETPDGLAKPDIPTKAELGCKNKEQMYYKLLELTEVEKAHRYNADTPYFDYTEEKWVMGEICYLPLRLAYAATVHKTQGLTLDTIQIDYSNAFFGQPSMSYVALSRVKSPLGLRVIGTPQLLARRTNISSEVLKWL